MTHDPLCIEPQTDYPCKRCWEIECECLCICDIIAKVREDERQKTFDADWSEMGQLAAVGLFRRQAARDMLAKCIALIEESVPWSRENWIAVDERAAILTALRDLQEKQ
jgi:hypothetical protein